MSMRLNDGKATDIIDQTESFLITSDGADPLTLKVGTSSGPATLEITDSWDSASNDVLEQVVETLFTYDFNNPDLPQINQLAENYWWEDTTTLHITLRQDILFHDYTTFNAAAAKWNLDRLLYLTNCTGTNTGQVAQTRSLWLLPNGDIPIIADVSTVGDWNITITLNAPYGPLLHLLSYINAGMLSPSSTLATEFIDFSGQLIGTGPFTFEYYDLDIEVKLTRWDNYWKAPAYFEELLFVIFSDTTIAHDAMLAYEIDINKMASDQNLAIYEADPKIEVKRFTDDTGKPSLVYQYIGVNNHKFNVTWRKVMAYAVNYTYIIDELRLGNAIRAHSPISPGFGASFNASATGPDMDIEAARLLMQSMGFGVGFTTEAEWTSAAFLSIPYTYNIGNTFREDLYVSVQNTMDLIGVDVVDDGVTWSEYLNYLIDDYDHLGLFAIGWGPDYLDPYSMFSPLFNPESSSNTAQVNDIKLTTMMEACLSETNEAASNIIYQNIQGYMADYGFFHIPLYHPKLTYVHLKEIKGVPYNAMVDFYAYPIYRATPDPFSLSSDAGSPDDDGIFTLNWDLADGADNYSVYQHSGYITEINESLILLAEEITDLNLALNGYSEGTYYFIVVAHNEYGDTLSNCIQVVVDIPVPPLVIYDTIPDEVILTYTRTSQIIGSIGAYSSSQIIFVGWVGEVDPGFALFTTYTEYENGGIYISETTISTTNQLETGVHLLNLRIWSVEGIYDKSITVIVYRQAQLNLRGEFDYLLKENVKISIVAQVFDVEDQFLLNPIAIEGMTVHIKIVDYDGNVKVEDTMTYDSNGFFHWDSVQTISQMKNIFTKGIYIVQAWIEFPPESYYLGGMDVIEFHIDPPAEDEVDVWFFMEMLGFSGLIGAVLTLAILLKRKRSIE